MVKISKKKIQNLFHVFRNIPINKKQTFPEKNLRWSKIGGGGSKLGMTAVKDSNKIPAQLLQKNGFLGIGVKSFLLN